MNVHFVKIHAGDAAIQAISRNLRIENPWVRSAVNRHENWCCQTWSGPSTDLFPVENRSFV